MDYEKKYNEALERAKELHGTVAAGRDFLVEIFPELRESEDERIRKAIINYILYETKGNISEATEHVWVTWLEKQKEQKPAEWSEEDEHRREGVVEWLRDHQKTIDRNSNDQAYESIESLISWLKSLRPSWKPSDENEEPEYSTF